MLKILLRWLPIALCTLPVQTAFAKKKAVEQSRAMRVPVRLTAGSSNQMMGVLSPDGRALYFVSDRNATSEIFVQDPVDSGPRLLFESNADVSWPLLGPDGRYLAYLSYKSDAAGDLCTVVLDTSERRCLTGMGSAEVQVMWMGKDIAVLSRSGLHADYQLERFDVDGGIGTVVLQRNMLGPALSPDGRWLAYVPLLRTADRVGVSFANRTGEGLRLQRLDGSPKEAEPVAYDPDLPGTTGFPAFSRDGRFLFFSQYLNDTNGDGVIDGNDNSILFRVPFEPGAENPVTAWPEQLTSAHWNCRYPAPAADRLVMTCSLQGSLDIYSLPLDGAVPRQWKTDRVEGELHVARNHWTKLFLLGRLLNLKKTPAERIQVLRQMVHLHVDLREYESAGFYCEQIRRLSGEAPGTDRESNWADVMLQLVAHRREDVALTHGQLSDHYISVESDRARRLEALAGKLHSRVEALMWTVVSEIQADVGRKDRAKKTFARVDLQKVDDPLVLHVASRRARRLNELRGDRQALQSLFVTLSSHRAFDELERLHFAELLVHELVRGVPVPQRPPRVEAQLAELPQDSEAALMLHVAGWLLRLDEGNQEEVRRGLFDIYKKNRDVDRRRALVLATIRMAARLGNEYLQYQFATSWASWLKRSNPERRYAEELYRLVVLERAYSELAKGRISEARGYFYSTTMQTTSLEAHAGFIEALLREGKGDPAKKYAKRYKKKPDDPAYAFARAYLIARGLPGISGPVAFDRAVEQAIGHVQKASRSLPRSMELHHLWGYLLHQRYIRTDDRPDAISAHNHYLLALDLARSNPRSRAALQQQLGLLQASLGNHRIALRYYDERDRLPDVRPEGELNLRMARARSLFHISKHAEAVEEAKKALVLVGAHEKLVKYRPLVNDRLALYQQVTGEHADAMIRYEALVRTVDAAGGADLGSVINRIKVRIGLASASLSAGRHQRAIGAIRAAEELLESGKPLRSAPAEGRAESLIEAQRFDREDYVLLLSGLTAQALRAQGKHAGAEEAMRRRLDMVARRFEVSETDEDLLELARIRQQLAEMAYRQKKPDDALRHLEEGLRRSRAYNQSTGSGVNPVGLRLRQAYAELRLYGGLDPHKFSLAPKALLDEAYEFICEHPSPSWEADRFLFEIYLTMFDIGG